MLGWARRHFDAAGRNHGPDYYVRRLKTADPRARRVALVHYVLDRQMELIREIYKENIPPLVFIPYKEMNEVYNDGLDRVLARKEYSRIMLMWAEDNYGSLRQTPGPAEKKRPGGAGLYDHASFIGWPTHNRWLNSISLSLMCPALRRAGSAGRQARLAPGGRVRAGKRVRGRGSRALRRTPAGQGRQRVADDPRRSPARRCREELAR